VTPLNQVALGIREVTDEEVSFFWRNGWAFLPGLISQEVSAELLARSKKLMGERGDANELRPVLDQESELFNTRYRPDLDDDVFLSVRTDPQMGRSAARLLGKDMKIRSLNNFVAVKLPADLQTDKKGKGPTVYHQDHGAMPYRGESLVFWIALDEVTPEMGAMRFYNGSHQLNWLAGDPLTWPRLNEFPLSEPVRYQPGDATVHGTMVVHGAPENRTDRSRWSYIVNYFPDDAVYTGLAGRATVGADDVLVAGEPFPEHPYYPTVYVPENG
jgi:Phytanoyl-CoA dioxygenase (PhyH)